MHEYIEKNGRSTKQQQKMLVVNAVKEKKTFSFVCWLRTTINQLHFQLYYNHLIRRISFLFYVKKFLNGLYKFPLQEKKE